jgi:hypothetical protein
METAQALLRHLVWAGCYGNRHSFYRAAHTRWHQIGIQKLYSAVAMAITFLNKTKL